VDGRREAFRRHGPIRQPTSQTQDNARENSAAAVRCRRLTLLFIGAAKEVPEAAKTVTAGTARPHFKM
jgi:hypothetical protein